MYELMLVFWRNGEIILCKWYSGNDGIITDDTESVLAKEATVRAICSCLNLDITPLDNWLANNPNPYIEQPQEWNKNLNKNNSEIPNNVIKV